MLVPLFLNPPHPHHNYFNILLCLRLWTFVYCLLFCEFYFVTYYFYYWRAQLGLSLKFNFFVEIKFCFCDGINGTYSSGLTDVTFTLVNFIVLSVWNKIFCRNYLKQILSWSYTAVSYVKLIFQSWKQVYKVLKSDCPWKPR